MSGTLYKPACAGCPHNLYFGDAIPQKQFGVMMHCGERFCTGGKRARRFKRGDPKIYVPNWCPKRKSPCELRIYTFKNLGDWYAHTQLSAYLGRPVTPSAYRYALESESTIDLTPYEFWKQLQLEHYVKLLGRSVPNYSVVEIDDGLKPGFFYMTENGLALEHSFDAARARKNVMEESV